MRNPPEKPTFTFRSGVTVTLERVGPLFALPIQKAFPPPSPPLAPGVGGQMEPNPSDPDYERAMTDYRAALQLRIQDALLDAAISDDLEVDAAAVARLRRLAAKHGGTIEDDDRLAYIKYCLVSHADDLALFLAAVSNYGSVTEEGIRAAGAMFSGDGGGGES